MFAGQQPDPSWRQALPPPDEPAPAARGVEPAPAPRRPEPADAKATATSSRAVEFLAPLILLMGVVGVAAVVLAGFIWIVALRPYPVPKTVARPLPALAAAVPPLVAVASNPLTEAIEPERFSFPQPPPIQYGVPEQATLDAAPPSAPADGLSPPPPRVAAPDVLTPLPPHRPAELSSRPSELSPRPPALSPLAQPPTGYDRLTAIYDITAHTVYLPDGSRLEAHSGLGDRLDDPRYVNERDHGATPPHLYELTLRELLFHGVQALRLTPVGGGFVFDRVGLLAHPYMLGPSGDSNGCVSFKNYDAFLAAFQNGQVKRLAVVARLTQEPSQFGRLASLGLGANR